MWCLLFCSMSLSKRRGRALHGVGGCGVWINKNSSCMLSLLLTSAQVAGKEKTGGKEKYRTERRSEMKMRPIHRARLSAPLDTMLQSNMALPRLGACGKVANLSFF